MMYVKAKVEFEGIHQWDDAPERVEYLNYPHRHIFTIIAKKKVEHGDRDVEFICLKHDIAFFLVSTYSKVDNIYSLHHTSCEMLAEKLLKQFDLLECEVWEDMENCGGVTCE